MKNDIKRLSTGRTKANTARDGNIAIREEFDAAIAENTRAAYELFIARHPDSQWTPEAKKRLSAL